MIRRLSRFCPGLLGAMAALLPILGAAQGAEPVASTAAGYQRVERFMQGLTSLEAGFRQVLRDSRGQIAERSSGTLRILRPDRFRWDYSAPHSQSIVSDGERLWLFDPDLEQATVRRLDQSLAGTPAMLLSGSGDLRAGFDVERVEQREDVFWVVMVPKRSDTDFRRIRLGFQRDALRFMELDDKLNQTTMLEFVQLSRNPPLAAGVFSFQPPPGTDVIGETGAE